MSQTGSPTAGATLVHLRVDLLSDKLCPFKFTVKWDFFGLYVTVEKKGFGYPNHKNHIKGDLSKYSLPMQLISGKEKEII
jgi:hypothetical protein